MTASRILAALFVAGALIAAGCGGSGSGDTSSSTGGNGIDRAFVAGMVPHHESAVQMARIAQDRGQSAFVNTLSRNIITSQTAEIATLRREDEQLAAGGIKPGSLGVAEHMMGMDGDVASLKTAEPFDAAFMKMMLPHHAGAIEMAKVELKRGQDPQLKALAQGIISAQMGEIAGMRRQLGGAAPKTDGTSSMDHGGSG